MELRTCRMKSLRKSKETPEEDFQDEQVLSCLIYEDKAFVSVGSLNLLLTLFPLSG
jgi:hypothetical protein